jgi:AcrR family transcriptional regulator
MAKAKIRKGRRKSKDDYHHGNLRRSLIGAALKLLKTRPPQSLSLRELAFSAGVSQAAPYRHFKNKERLLAAIAQEGFEIQSRYMEETLRKFAEKPVELYVECGLSYLRMGLSHPQHFKLMFGGIVIPKHEHPEFMMAASKTFVLLRQMIEVCQGAGLIGAGDPYHKAMNCWSVVHGFTILYTEGRMEWLGVTADNASEALRALLLQYLDGNRSSLDKKAFSFNPFQTTYSKTFKEIMDQIDD